MAAFASVLLLALATLSAHAATLVVTSLADTGAGSLREAIAAASANDEIVFAPGLEGTITLASSLAITRSVSIFGNAGIVIDGANAVRPIAITDGTAQVTLDRLVIQHGLADDGGAIFSVGTLVLNEVTLRDNHATSRGGALFVSLGRFTIVDSTIADNEAVGEGGGIVDLSTSPSFISRSQITGNMSNGPGGGIRHVSTQPLTIVGSTISGNQTALTTSTIGGGIASQGGTLSISYSSIVANQSWFGGGVIVQNLATSGTLELSNSLVAGNTATSDGGGVFVFGVLANISNSTIANNVAAAGGGGGVSMQNSSAGTAIALLSNATVAQNRATTNGGGIGVISGALTLRNSLLAGNVATTNSDLNGAFTSQGVNLVQTRGTSTGYGGNDFANGTNPLLGNLTFNGGPTNTIALQPGSPAINALNAAGCTGIPIDQRGFARPNSGCDVGAYEVGGAPLPDALFNSGFE